MVYNDRMGMTDAVLTIKNPRDPRKKYQGTFLVDSGATYTVVSGLELRKLGIKPQRKETFVLADGKTIERVVGSCLYEYQGREAAAPVLFGEKGDSQLLGMFTLEAFGLTLDPLKRTLQKALLRL